MKYLETILPWFIMIGLMLSGLATIGLGIWGIYLDLAIHHIPGFITYNLILIVFGCMFLTMGIASVLMKENEYVT